MTAEGTTQQFHTLKGRPAADFMLHRKPMLLVDTLVEIGAEYAVCEWKVQSGDSFWQPGLGVPAYIGIEYMAQCVAVHAGACESVAGLPAPMGMLLGTRRFKTDVAYFEEGHTYQSRCQRLIQGSDGVAAFVCNITCEGQVIAEARLSVWQIARGGKFNE